jgi:hypothetical protein
MPLTFNARITKVHYHDRLAAITEWLQPQHGVYRRSPNERDRFVVAHKIQKVWMNYWPNISGDRGYVAQWLRKAELAGDLKVERAIDHTAVAVMLPEGHVHHEPLPVVAALAPPAPGGDIASYNPRINAAHDRIRRLETWAARVSHELGINPPS